MRNAKNLYPRGFAGGGSKLAPNLIDTNSEISALNICEKTCGKIKQRAKNWAPFGHRRETPDLRGLEASLLGASNRDGGSLF